MRDADIPINAAPFYLDENCRNTREIHAKSFAYTATEREIYCHGPKGRPVEIIPAENETAARKKLRKVLHRLIQEEGIPPHDIVILTPRSEKNSWWREGDKLGTLTLSWNLNTIEPNTVRVCTIRKFKGLESPVVILTQLDQAHEDVRNQLVYVGLTRASNHAIVIGELPKPRSIKEPKSGHYVPQLAIKEEPAPSISIGNTAGFPSPAPVLEPQEELLSSQGNILTEDNAQPVQEVLIEDYVDAHFARAKAYIDQGNYEKAIEEYDRVLELNANFAEAWLNKGSALLNLGRHQEALPCIEKASELGMPQAKSMLRRMQPGQERRRPKKETFQEWLKRQRKDM